jgi:acyl carrier protein
MEGNISSSENEIKMSLTNFLITNFLFGNDQRRPKDSDSLIGTGIIDSTGILELIQYLEQTYGIEIKETETIPQNLDSVDNIARFVVAKSEELRQLPSTA